MKKGDYIVIIIILIASFAMIIKNERVLTQDNKALLINIDGKEEKKYSIEENIGREIEINNEYGKNIIKITKDGALMTYSDCKDQVCVHAREIKNKGDSRICLPHRLEITIDSNKDKEIDAVVK